VRIIFQRWGAIEEVFISRKVNCWGNRFDFVRFWDVKNSVKLERELDAIRIGIVKLFVNFPRYAKGGDKAIIQRYPPKHMTNVHTEQRRKIVKQWHVKEGTKRGNTHNRNELNDKEQCITSPQMTPP